MLMRYQWYDKFHLFMLFIKVDENCNMNCSFCYQGSKKQRRLDTDEKIDKAVNNIKYTIDKFLEIIKDERLEFSTLSVCFFGGEPTLNCDAIIKISDRLSKIYSKKQLSQVGFSMTTNGVILNKNVYKALKCMKSLNDNPISLLISTDNNKEAFDKKRKLNNSSISVFEVVNNNIERYKKLLKELNGDRFTPSNIMISSVLNSSEELHQESNSIQNEYKGIVRRGRLLYDATGSLDYINEARNFISKTYKKTILKLNKDNKDELMEEILFNMFRIYHSQCFTECQSIVTIDADGDFNWCNKHRYFGEDIKDQSFMKDSVFNPKIDNSHFDCVKEKFHNGKVIKGPIMGEIWSLMISFFDPNVNINDLNIYDPIDSYTVRFVKYMMGSSHGSKKIYMKHPDNRIIELCREHDIKIVEEPIKYKNIPAFCIYGGDLYFDISLINDKLLSLSNLKSKHFMWIHTPSLLTSVNKYFSNTMKNI